MSSDRSTAHELASTGIQEQTDTVYGLQQASQGYFCPWFHSFLLLGDPMPLYHFWIAVDTRSPSILIEFHDPQWWWHESKNAPDSLFFLMSVS